MNETLKKLAKKYYLLSDRSTGKIETVRAWQETFEALQTGRARYVDVYTQFAKSLTVDLERLVAFEEVIQVMFYYLATMAQITMLKRQSDTEAKRCLWDFYAEVEVNPTLAHTQTVSRSALQSIMVNFNLIDENTAQQLVTDFIQITSEQIQDQEQGE